MESEVNKKILDIYKASGMSMDEIISSLKKLLATAKMSQERVNN